MRVLRSVHIIRWMGKATPVKVYYIVDDLSDLAVGQGFRNRCRVPQRYSCLIRVCFIPRCVRFGSSLTVESKFENLDPEDMPIKTQLRLEASRRRIAEFFANVIIRFILQDLGMMMTKYVKRVNDWMVG